MDKVGLDPLFAYLNIQLELLSNFLYHNVFQRVIKQSFILLIKDLENVVVPFDLKDKQNNRRETARLIELSLKVNFLGIFFLLIFFTDFFLLFLYPKKFN